MGMQTTAGFRAARIETAACDAVVQITLVSEEGATPAVAFEEIEGHNFTAEDPRELSVHLVDIAEQLDDLDA